MAFLIQLDSQGDHHTQATSKCESQTCLTTHNANKINVS